MDRDEMLKVAEPFLVKLDSIMADALSQSGLTQADLHSVEVYGGTCRIPAVQDRIAKFFQKETVMKTMNMDECVAKGCALQCAMLSPAFKVRDFSVNDVTLYPIALSWSPSGGAAAAPTRWRSTATARRARRPRRARRRSSSPSSTRCPTPRC